MDSSESEFFMDLKWTKKLPNKPGFYWYTDGGEETPCILRVTKDNGRFWAQDEEFCFGIDKSDGEFWCFVPEPIWP